MNIRLRFVLLKNWLWRNDNNNFFFFFKHNFCVKPYVPREPRRDWRVIVGSMNMGYISDTARDRTHNLFRLKREPIPLYHSDGDNNNLMWGWPRKSRSTSGFAGTRCYWWMGRMDFRNFFIPYSFWFQGQGINFPQFHEASYYSIYV